MCINMTVCHAGCGALVADVLEPPFVLWSVTG